LEEAAEVAAGNWRRFESFCWHLAGDLDDAEQWAIVYTHHRDAGLLDQSNAEAIRKALEPFFDADEPDVIAERHGHWAVGWIDGFAVRVIRGGQITEAFKAYHELAERLANYPVLDEEDFSRREFDATLENIADAARSLRDDYDLPEGWEAEVFSWFWDNNQRAVESRDDVGGYPQRHELLEAFESLGYGPVEG
jgi:hypothetical protein